MYCIYAWEEKDNRTVCARWTYFYGCRGWFLVSNTHSKPAQAKCTAHLSTVNLLF